MQYRSWLDGLTKGAEGHPVRRPPAGVKPSVEILEARCLPSFLAPVNYAVDTYSLALVSADFNNDTVLDQAVANLTSNTVGIMLGNGNGTFQPVQNVATGVSSSALAVGDFNGDGKRDLATINGNVNVLLGNGNGTFQAPRSVALPGQFPPGYDGLTPQSASSVAVGDLNNDGKMDLAVTGDTSFSRMYWGYWGPYYVFQNDSYVNVLLGHGDGTFASPTATHQSAVGTGAIALGAVNADSNLDVITSDASGVVRVFPGNGNGTLQAPSVSAATVYAPVGLAVGDFDANGRTDVVTRYGDTANVLLGNGNGTLQAPQPYAVGGAGSTVAVADFNHDGKPDVVTAGYNSDVTVLLGNGDGTFRSAQHSAAGPGPWDVAVGDFNGDAFPDLAAITPWVGTVSVLVNNQDWRSFRISGFPSTTTAGSVHAVTVTALDSAGNVLTGYTGTVHFTSSDPQAVLPPDYTFTAADGGAHTFAVALKTVPVSGPAYQTVTVADTANGGVSDTLQAAVTPAAPGGFAVGFTGDGYLSVIASDPYGNRATNYTGTVHFTSSDPQALLPADYTFTAWDNGYTVFEAAVQSVGTHSITVTDTVTGATGSVTGLRVDPYTYLDGPNVSLRNQALTFTLLASALPAGFAYTYKLDWNGDGVVDQTVTGTSGTTVMHSYATTGLYWVGVTATVQIGSEVYTSGLSTRPVTVSGVTVTVQTDPGDATRKALVVQGTASADDIRLYRGDGNAVEVLVGGWSVGSYSAPGGAAFGHLLVYGNGGDDGISLEGNLIVPALLFGGDGNDTLIADGSSANNVLVGGAGDDGLYGGGTRDLLIGGLGADTLRAAFGGSIMIGTYTDYDANLPALMAIVKEWGRTDANYTTRLKHLQGTQSGGLNGSYRLTATTVHDDNAIDNLYGWDGQDWFFVGGGGRKKDKVYDKTSGETTTNI